MPKTRIDRPEAKLSLTVLRRELDQLEQRLRETDAKITARLRSLARAVASYNDAAPDAPPMVA